MSKVRIYIIPHWHFDALWQLSFKDYFKITAENLADLLEFLKVEPEFRFNIDQTVYVEEFAKKYPELYEEFKRAVKEGLIEFVCSGYTQPDSNIPSGEFLVRNIVLFQEYVEREFGVRAKCGWFIDVYGQSGQLPQIFKKAGIDYFVFWRGVPDGLPSDFLWEGIDGTRILAHRTPKGYSSGYIPEGRHRYFYFVRSSDEDGAVEFLEGSLEGVKKRAPTENILLLNGDDFSPPQRFLVRVVKRWRELRRDYDIRIATASEYFEAVKKHQDKLTVYKGEFNPIFRGTYSARIEIKKTNRRLENLYLTAEKYATIAWLLGRNYPVEKLEKALKLILMNQFHDAINGEVVDEVYDEIVENYRTAEKILEEILEESLEAIASLIDTEADGEKIPIVVFNPLSWSRTDVVSVEVAFADPGARSVRVLDSKGREVPCQTTRVSRNPDGSLNMVEVVFTAEKIPALGYRVYYIEPVEAPSESKYSSSIKVSEREGEFVLENSFFRIVFDTVSKNIVRIYDKEAGREVLNTSKYQANALFMEPDYGTVCNVNGGIDAHQAITPIKDPPNPTTLNTSMCVPQGLVAEKGPVRAVMVSKGVIGNSKYTQLTIIYDKVKRIDFITEIEFGDENKRLRVVFPVNIKKGEIWHEIPYGAIKRSEGEYPAINWVDYSNNDYGVTLINKGIPGNSVVENTLILTLLRSINAMYLSAPIGQLRLIKLAKAYLERSGKYYIYYEMGPKALEKGYHIFEYSLYPHEKSWREAKSYKVALEFNNPLILLKTTKHKGKLPKEYSFLKLFPENLVLVALKKSFKGSEVILRFYEAEGRKTEGKITFFKEIEVANETNLVEEKIKELKVDENTVSIEANPFEIITVSLKVKQ